MGNSSMKANRVTTNVVEPEKEIPVDIPEEDLKKTESGALAYEVCLSPPKKSFPATPLLAKSPASIDEIEERLKSADERRQSFESTRVESLKKKDEERKHVTQRRLELESEFRSQVAEKLEQKMLKVSTNCEEKLKEMQAKAEDQNKKLAQAKERLDQMEVEKKEQVMEMLEKRLAAADEHRQKILNGLKKKLQQHDARVEEVRCRWLQADTDELKTDLEKRLEEANTRRNNFIQSVKDRLHDHDKQVDEAKLRAAKEKENRAPESCADDETPVPMETETEAD